MIEPTLPTPAEVLEAIQIELPGLSPQSLLLWSGLVRMYPNGQTRVMVPSSDWAIGCIHELDDAGLVRSEITAEGPSIRLWIDHTGQWATIYRQAIADSD